ncbi:hypothetical protein Vadar_025114 [Vaccinium darrowii]|uniref:Uncharacterized protein n=1 Tax=Vaccinium darrowii TaxID=229202 RepID=A0ACB7X407_9ERIC|nr:hypothetical protein Vadar_025114 [Vaccinium darrowii]
MSMAYGFIHDLERRRLWQDRRYINSVVQGAAWVQLRDFNVVRRMNERLEGFERMGFWGFEHHLEELEMEDMPSRGFWFSWSNKRGGLGHDKSRIDRALVTPSWLNKFPDSEAVLSYCGRERDDDEEEDEYDDEDAERDDEEEGRDGKKGGKKVEAEAEVEREEKAKAEVEREEEAEVKKEKETEEDASADEEVEREEEEEVEKVEEEVMEVKVEEEKEEVEVKVEVEEEVRQEEVRKQDCHEHRNYQHQDGSR